LSSFSPSLDLTDNPHLYSPDLAISSANLSNLVRIYFPHLTFSSTGFNRDRIPPITFPSLTSSESQTSSNSVNFWRDFHRPVNIHSMASSKRSKPPGKGDLNKRASKSQKGLDGKPVTPAKTKTSDEIVSDNEAAAPMKKKWAASDLKALLPTDKQSVVDIKAALSKRRYVDMYLGSIDAAARAHLEERLSQDAVMRKQKVAKADVCAFCPEKGEKGQEKEAIHTAQLACGHSYHESCMMQQQARYLYDHKNTESHTCGYTGSLGDGKGKQRCGADLRPFFDSDYFNKRCFKCQETHFKDSVKKRFEDSVCAHELCDGCYKVLKDAARKAERQTLVCSHEDHGGDGQSLVDSLAKYIPARKFTEVITGKTVKFSCQICSGVFAIAYECAISFGQGDSGCEHYWCIPCFEDVLTEVVREDVRKLWCTECGDFYRYATLTASKAPRLRAKLVPEDEPWLAPVFLYNEHANGRGLWVRRDRSHYSSQDRDDVEQKKAQGLWEYYDKSPYFPPGLVEIDNTGIWIEVGVLKNGSKDTEMERICTESGPYFNERHECLADQRPNQLPQFQEKESTTAPEAVAESGGDELVVVDVDVDTEEPSITSTGTAFEVEPQKFNGGEHSENTEEGEAATEPEKFNDGEHSKIAEEDEAAKKPAEALLNSAESSSDSDYTEENVSSRKPAKPPKPPVPPKPRMVLTQAQIDESLLHGVKDQAHWMKIIDVPLEFQGTVARLEKRAAHWGLKFTTLRAQHVVKKTISSAETWKKNVSDFKSVLKKLNNHFQLVHVVDSLVLAGHLETSVNARKKANTSSNLIEDLSINIEQASTSTELATRNSDDDSAPFSEDATDEEFVREKKAIDKAKGFNDIRESFASMVYAGKVKAAGYGACKALAARYRDLHFKDDAYQSPELNKSIYEYYYKTLPRVGKFTTLVFNAIGYSALVICRDVIGASSIRDFNNGTIALLVQGLRNHPSKNFRHLCSTIDGQCKQILMSGQLEKVKQGKLLAQHVRDAYPPDAVTAGIVDLQLVWPRSQQAIGPIGPLGTMLDIQDLRTLEAKENVAAAVLDIALGIRFQSMEVESDHTKYQLISAGLLNFDEGGNLRLTDDEYDLFVDSKKKYLLPAWFPDPAHWVLATVTVHPNYIVVDVFDSWSTGCRTRQNKIHAAIDQFVQQSKHSSVFNQDQTERKRVSSRQVAVPAQINDFDCGIHTIQAAHGVMFPDERNPFSGEFDIPDSAAARLQIYVEIVAELQPYLAELTANDKGDGSDDGSGSDGESMD
jgi:hypothetical protein